MLLTNACSLLTAVSNSQLYNNTKEISMEDFRAIFGVTVTVGGHVYLKLVDYHGSYCPKKLLMGLHFLKTYCNAATSAILFRVDRKTFSSSSWAAVKDIASLELINFQARITPQANHKVRMSVDGTDFRIREPSPFSPIWHSHKFRGPGLRYEVGVGICSGGIVWVNGPFPCGSWPDLNIARDGLVNFLEEGEKVIADGGYGGDSHFLTPTGVNDNFNNVMSVIRARHETVNGRLKSFNVLATTFRHSLGNHSQCFMAVANLVQVSLLTEAPLFDAF